ncbi:MAG: hypothetical protein GKR93_18960 [Gammaproteobacteria bacterium]|nr:hypothetical protein [Gammaproteobacteria bacterium]
MANQSLRELAKEHAQGNLDREAYKKSRSDLIQGILSSTIPLKEIDYPPLVQPPESESLDDTQRKEDYKKPPAASAEAEATTSPKPAVARSTTDDHNVKASNKLLIAVLALAIIAILVVAALLLSGKSEDSAITVPAGSTETGQISNASVITKSDELIKEFLAGKNWSASSLDTFREKWSNLSDEEMPSSQGNLAIGQLTNAIYKQLLEEQALSGLVDDDSSLNKQQQLIEFADALGINDNRLILSEDN